MFEGMSFDDKNSPFQVLSSLTDKENPETKSELSMDQIRVMTAFKYHSECAKEENKNKSEFEIMMLVLEYYLSLKVSYNRKGRLEIVQGLTDINRQWLDERDLLNMNKK